MAKGINKVIIVGNVGNDPDVRYLPSGAAVTNISVATSESWTDKQSGQKQERTEWHKVALMDRGNYQLGKIAGDFIKKGSKVYIEGSLRTREWEKDGVKRYTTEIIASEMQLLDSRQDGGQGQQGGYNQHAPQNNQGGFNQQPQQQQSAQQAQPQSFGSWGNQPANGYANAQGGQARQQPNQQARQQAPQQNQQPQQSPNFDEFDDDIPFN